ncbi:MAG: hypothetical protein L3J09_10930 [Flavobacteriaceae bacterium]|nr:hypothetical protein [Flavobacteriaceae bacterium]
MKNLLSYTLIAFLLFAGQGFAQESYSVNGKQLTLKTESEGSITLLWNIIDGEYRYFIKKGNNITELTNTKTEGHYQDEYLQILQSNTSDENLSEDKVKLTKESLADYFDKYNKRKDPDYVVPENNVKLKTRLGAFAGITNAVYSPNPTNQILPTMGLEFEIVDLYKLKRHSLVVQFKQTFESSDYKYSASQFSLSYRFKFVKKEKLDVFINTKIAGYTFQSIPKFDENDNPIPDENGDPIIDSDDSFSALMSFGLGADYKLGDGYLTFLYSDIVSVVEGSNGEFPMDFTIGYKFNL